MLDIKTKGLIKKYLDTNYKPPVLYQMANNMAFPNKGRKDLEEFLKNKIDSKQYFMLTAKYVNELNDDGKSLPMIQKDSTIPSSTFYRIVQGGNTNMTPEKKNLIKLCIGLELNMTKTEELMKCWGYAFSNNSLFDLVCQYFFTNWKYEKKDRGKMTAVSALQEYVQEFCPQVRDF